MMAVLVEVYRKTVGPPGNFNNLNPELHLRPFRFYEQTQSDLIIYRYMN